MPGIPHSDPRHVSHPVRNQAPPRRPSKPGDHAGRLARETDVPDVVNRRASSPKRGDKMLKALEGKTLPDEAPAGSRWPRIAALVLAVTLSSVYLASAQPPSPDCDLPPAGVTVQNPTRVCFEVSADHDTIDGYALDLVDDQGTVIQTLDMGLPAPVTTGDGSRWIVWSNLNVMPHAFGSYTSVARAYAGGVSGPDSLVSNDWDRTPGPPSSAPRVVERPHLVPIAD